MEKIIQQEIALKDKWKIFNVLGTIDGENSTFDDDISFQRTTELPPVEESESENEAANEYEEYQEDDEINIDDI